MVHRCSILTPQEHTINKYGLNSYASSILQPNIPCFLTWKYSTDINLTEQGEQESIREGILLFSLKQRIMLNDELHDIKHRNGDIIAERAEIMTIRNTAAYRRLEIKSAVRDVITILRDQNNAAADFTGRLG